LKSHDLGANDCAPQNHGHEKPSSLQKNGMAFMFSGNLKE